MRLVGGTLPILMVLMGVACGGAEDRSATTERDPQDVAVVTVRSVPLEARLAMVGTVRAVHAVNVAARLLSYVRSVAVAEGDLVRAGQTLVVLDDRELRADVEAARAARHEAASAIVAAEQQVESARSELHLVELTHARYTDLLAKESVSQHEHDVVVARLAASRSAVAAAETGRVRAEAGRARADAVLARAEVALGDTVVASPVDGIVTARLVDPGALAAPGTPLVRVERLGAYRLEVEAPASLRSSLDVGQMVPFVIDGPQDGDPLPGTVDEIVPSIDPRSRTFTVKIALPQTADVRSGQYGRAFLPGETRETLLVPRSAVVQRGQLRFVMVVRDDRARRRSVTVGESNPSGHEVLSGLEGGERVVVDPTGIGDGDPVVSREHAS